MTPAITQLENAGIHFEILSYDASHITDDFGRSVLAHLDLIAAETFKTLLAKTDSHEFIVAVIPVTGRLNLKRLAAAAAAKKAHMAEPSSAEKLTGYVCGGISPLGQKKRLRTFIDQSAEQQSQIHISGGKRGLSVTLAPMDLMTLLAARTADLTDQRP